MTHYRNEPHVSSPRRSGSQQIDRNSVPRICARWGSDRWRHAATDVPGSQACGRLTAFQNILDLGQSVGKATYLLGGRCRAGITKGTSMKKTALIVAALAVGVMAAAAPAEARGFRGYGGAGIGLGIAAGALAAGAYGAYGPGYGYGYGPGNYAPRYVYGPGYGYYGRGYYRGGPRYYGYY
jgi:hypothetical protein